MRPLAPALSGSSAASSAAETKGETRLWRTSLSQGCSEAERCCITREWMSCEANPLVCELLRGARSSSKLVQGLGFRVENFRV